MAKSQEVQPSDPGTQPPPSQSDQTKANKEILNRLAELGGRLTAEDDIKFEGQKVVLPATMKIGEAIRFLNKKLELDEEPMGFSRNFNYRPWDGAYCTMNALKRVFGVVGQIPTQGFFGATPPQMIDISVSAIENVSVPWGQLIIPILPDVIFALQGTQHPDFGPIFRLQASGPRRCRFEIEGIFKMVQEELETNSLYRGKSFDGADMPNFLDLSGVSPDKVIYSDDVMTQLEANVWSLLRYTPQMRSLGVPLKRAVLFEGPYGTGKTLGAYLTAQVAVQNGWTFVYCRPGRDELSEVMATARLYQPAVVFFEDVDTVSNGDENLSGSDSVSTLLDLFDGIQSKNTEIICVLTTNHVEKIHKGMVRPGRLDAVIHIGALDAGGIQRLVESLVPPNLLDVDMQWDKVVTAMEGFLPAFAREAVDRTVRYNVSRNRGTAGVLLTDDFVQAANGLRPQLQLMEEAKELGQRSSVDTAIANLVTDAITDLTFYDNDSGIDVSPKKGRGI